MKKVEKGVITSHAIYSFCDIANAIAKYVGKNLTDEFLMKNFYSLFNSGSDLDRFLGSLLRSISPFLKKDFAPLETGYSVFRMVNSVIAAMEYPEDPNVVDERNIREIAKQSFPWIDGNFKKRMISVGNQSFEAFIFKSKRLVYIIPGGVDYSFTVMKQDVEF
jgi:hypothetical protein